MKGTYSILIIVSLALAAALTGCSRDSENSEGSTKILGYTFEKKGPLITLRKKEEKVMNGGKEFTGIKPFLATSKPVAENMTVLLEWTIIDGPDKKEIILGIATIPKGEMKSSDQGHFHLERYTNGRRLELRIKTYQEAVEFSEQRGLTEKVLPYQPGPPLILEF